MRAETPSPDNLLAGLRERLGARAAGWWRVSGDRLELVAFASAPDMPEEVARSFAEATRSVALSRSELGIVRAAASGHVTVSLASELPAESGSGLWLRRFGATRSVAVPVRAHGPGVARIVSLALRDGPASDLRIATTIESIASAWADP
jgi:hypothetical protein